MYGNGDALDVLNTAVAFIVIAYFMFLLITNQRLVVLTSNSVQISPQQNITEHSVHMGTAFIAAIVLIPRVGMVRADVRPLAAPGGAGLMRPRVRAARTPEAGRRTQSRKLEHAQSYTQTHPHTHTQARARTHTHTHTPSPSNLRSRRRQ